MGNYYADNNEFAPWEIEKMKHTTPLEESVNEMLEALKPLGFVGNGKDTRRFTHTKLNRTFDFTAYSIDGALRCAVVDAFQMGVAAGVEANKACIREHLGL